MKNQNVTEKSIQIAIFKGIEDRIQYNFKLNGQIQEDLGINKTAAHRLINGIAPLRFFDYIKLAAKYNFLLAFLGPIMQHKLFFDHINLDVKEHDNYYTYIGGLSANLTAIASAAHKKIIFVANDIPVFRFMPFTELTYFKLYCWNQSVNNLSVTYEEFVKTLDTGFLEITFRNIGVSYSQIPSQEVWTEETIDPILKLIRYYQGLSRFEDTGLALRLCDGLHRLLDQLEQETQSSRKNGGSGAAFDFYLYPLDITVSKMYFESGDNKGVMIKLFIIHSVATTDVSFSEESHKIMDSMIYKSAHLSGASESSRVQFFQRMRDKVALLRQEL